MLLLLLLLSLFFRVVSKSAETVPAVLQRRLTTAANPASCGTPGLQIPAAMQPVVALR
jgi:hypothetical protein